MKEGSLERKTMNWKLALGGSLENYVETLCNKINFDFMCGLSTTKINEGAQFVSPLRHK